LISCFPSDLRFDGRHLAPAKNNDHETDGLKTDISMLRKVLLFASFITIVVLCQAAGIRSASDSPSAPQAQHPRPVKLGSVQVTPVRGPSWLDHLGRRLGESSMGWTGMWGPSPIQEEGAAPFNLTTSLESSISMSGADIFRVSCRACHGERGEGVPPEINSMVDPVRATSAELILDRMKKSGAPVSLALARQLASQSKTMLLNRIHQGGKNMPAFPQLTPPEVQALVAYLDFLVGIPGAESKQMTLEVPVAHVGEDLVKGTCHICHGATGLNPTPREMLQGAIPALAVLPKRDDVQQFVQKVTVGRPIIMGDLDLQYRGRMPVFFYLKSEEAAAAYMYLERYPPGEASRLQDGHPAQPAGNGSTAAKLY
jgi:mono/diheme cytochrome c family protein